MDAVAITKAIHAMVEEEEGGWGPGRDNANDPDTFTRAGVRLEIYNKVMNTNYIPAQFDNLPRERLVEFYVKEYIVEPGYTELPDCLIAPMISMAVNRGAKNANLTLQRAINRSIKEYGQGTGIKEDGDCGPKTKSAAIAICRLLGNTYVRNVLVSEWVRDYINLCQANARAWQESAESASDACGKYALAVNAQYNGSKDKLPLLIYKTPPSINRTANLEGWFNRAERYRING